MYATMLKYGKHRGMPRCFLWRKAIVIGLHVEVNAMLPNETSHKLGGHQTATVKMWRQEVALFERGFDNSHKKQRRAVHSGIVGMYWVNASTDDHDPIKAISQ